MHEEIGARELRRDLRSVLDHIAAGGDRLMVLRNGQEIAAIVRPSDLTALETADHSSMEYHETLQQAKLREIKWLRDGLDISRYENGQ